MSKVCGPVQRIYIPKIITAGLDAASLFAHYIVRRPLLANARKNQRFRFTVGNRHQIHIALVFHFDPLVEITHQESAGFAGNL